MAYVDLNPIRAALASTPEHSDYTSIQERIRFPSDHALKPFSEVGDQDLCLPFRLKDYLELVDWAGRHIHKPKQGHIPQTAPAILQRLAMDSAVVLDYLEQKPQMPVRALGSASQLRSMARSVGMKFLRGVSLGKRLFPEPG
jgi:hypothetical protein